jgi:hypothetical protein
MDHVQEVSNAGDSTKPIASIPKYPQFFSKVPETVIGPGDVIPSHIETTKWLDYEAELAVVIGKRGINIPEADALDYVFGYTMANDVSAREVQKRCVYVYMCAYMCACMYVYMCAYMCACMCLCVHICVCIIYLSLTRLIYKSSLIYPHTH